MLYLSASTKQYLKYNDGLVFGCMFLPIKTGNQKKALDTGTKFILDNGRFIKKYRADKDLWLREMRHKWIKMLIKLLPYQENCLGVTVPDTPFNCNDTIREYQAIYHIPKKLGYKCLIVTQNGMNADNMPWDIVDGVFVGGDNEHKRGIDGLGLCKMAHELGKYIHIGRVNSGSTLVDFFPYADSVDGSTFRFHPTQQLDSIKNGVMRSRELKRLYGVNNLLEIQQKKITQKSYKQAELF